MTSFSLPDSRRRFLQMLWLSAALHAAVIGLTRLPQQVQAVLPPELQVQLSPAAAQVSVPVPAKTPDPIPELVPRPVAPVVPQIVARPTPLLAPESMLRAQVSAPTQSNQPVAAAAPSAAVSNDAPGPQLNIPQVVDMRYYAVKELDAPPTTLRKPDPIYPPQAEEQGVSGSALLRLHLEVDGSVSQSEVIAATPGGVFGELFKQSALDSVKTLRFRPAKRNGLPVRALVEFRVVFKPDAD